VIIADTNVVSEFMRDEPDARALGWAQSLGSSELSICMVTVEEIERGLARLSAGHRRRTLEHRWNSLMDAFADMVAVYDKPAASATARVLVHAEASGRRMGLADAQIAGICLSGGRQLATRNVRDFADVPELAVVNPFA
jgi:predicted nucleic acid-binding protein